MAETDQDYSPDTTIGERLRVAREAKGLTLDEIAGQTRIPVRHLQHIETGDWEALPAITYSVGFVRSYGNLVGLDGQALGQELRQQLGAGTGRKAGPAPEYYEPADPARVPPRWLAITTVLIAVLLLGAYLIFRSGIDDGAEVASEEQNAAAAQQLEAQPQQPVQPLAQPSAAGQPVTLTAQSDVWLRVSDGGRTVTERTLAAGQSYQVPATAQAPTLRVGRPEALRVTVGQTQIPQLGPSGQPIGNVSLRGEDLVARASGTTSPPAAPAPTPAPAR
ncbi:MAG TPA: helix-turn-helix domain-containing protein [Allosphingosinicella sp.]|nr:helix-turn-helix domain-containing protein [Allosphingosinicella sp.]